MMYRERIFRDSLSKKQFEDSRDKTAMCIPLIEQQIGGLLIHNEMYNNRSFEVTLDVDYGIDMLWIRGRNAIPIGVRTSNSDAPYFSISCDNDSGQPAEYDEIKNNYLSPVYIFKITFEYGQPKMLYIVRADDLIEYIDKHEPRKYRSDKDKHWYYSIPMSSYSNYYVIKQYELKGDYYD